MIVIVNVTVTEAGCCSTLPVGAWTFRGTGLGGACLWGLGGGIAARGPWRCRSGGWGLVLVRALGGFGSCRGSRGVFRPVVFLVY